MPWDEKTPEYQDAIKRPTVRGGSFGIWLLRSNHNEVNLANVSYIRREVASRTHGGTEMVLYMNNGDKIPITDEEFAMWERFITPTPMQIEMILRESKMREQMMKEAAGGLTVIDRPL